MAEPIYIERTRKLAYSGQLLVQVGDWVNEQDVIGQIDYLPGAIRRVPVAAGLRVDGPQMPSYMLLAEGASVAVGETIAASDCFGERRQALSPYSGYIGLISRTLGHVYVREPIPLGASETVTIDVAGALGVRPTQMRDCLRVVEGQMVLPEQVIAVAGARNRRSFVKSPVYGQVVRIGEGQAVVQPTHVSTELRAGYAGRVVTVQPGQQAVIGAFAHVIKGQYGIGGEAGGALLVAGGPDDVLRADAASDAWQGKVVVGGKTADLAALQRAAAVGASALVVGHLPLLALQRYAQSDTLGITGNEKVPMTVILLSGFLPAALSEDIWENLTALAGRYATVNGSTHVRAGAVRPELVVCEHRWSDNWRRTPPAQPELAVGSSVQVIREPLFGMAGVVLELPAERRTIATGSLVRVAEVRLGNNCVATVPVSNLAVLSNCIGGEPHV